MVLSLFLLGVTLWSVDCGFCRLWHFHKPSEDSPRRAQAHEELENLAEQKPLWAPTSSTQVKLGDASFTTPTHEQNISLLKRYKRSEEHISLVGAIAEARIGGNQVFLPSRLSPLPSFYPANRGSHPYQRKA